MDDVFAWLAFAFLAERPTRSRGGTGGSNPLSSTAESAGDDFGSGYCCGSVTVRPRSFARPPSPRAEEGTGASLSADQDASAISLLHQDVHIEGPEHLVLAPPGKVGIFCHLAA